MGPLKAVLFGACLALPITSFAAFDFGAAENYNVYTFGNYEAYNGDTQGRIAVGGNFTVENYGVIEPEGHHYMGNINDQTVGTALVVGGTSSLADTTIYYGDAYLNGRSNTEHASFHHNLTLNNGGALNDSMIEGTLASRQAFTAHDTSWLGYTTATVNSPENFTSAQSYFTNYSSTLSSQYITGTGTHKEVDEETGQYLLTLTGDKTSSTQVFNLTADDLANAYDISLLGIGKADSVLINVDGSYVNMSNMGPHDTKGKVLNVNSIFLDSDVEVLYNFYNADSVELSSIGLYGTILAPTATIEGTEGVINGRMITDHFYSEANFQFNLDSSMAAAVPEPSTYVLLVAGLGLIGIMMRKRKIAFA